MEYPDKKNNQWYRINGDSPVVIIFVHGFFSKSETCWLSTEGVFWPDLILKDSRLSFPSIFLGGYYTDIDSGSYKISDCAEELFSEISRPQENGDRPPIQSNNLIFVCHSLGGLVARYMLESKSHKFKDKLVGVVLMASPSLGSTHADMFSFAARFYKNGLGHQLRVMNESLVDLDDRFKELIYSRNILQMVGAEAVEHKALFGWKWFPPLRPIVEHWSASRYFGRGRVLPGTNHSTIVKPNALNHPSHGFLVDFFLEKFKPIMKKSSFSYRVSYSSKEDMPIEDLVLFDILGKTNIQYYLNRDIDQELENNLKLYSVWASGPSGSGKTSAIRYLLDKRGVTPIDICLSHCGAHSKRDDFIREILTTANQLELQGRSDWPMTYQALVTLLADYSEISSIILHLDEVPVPNADERPMVELLDLVSDLLNAVKQRSGRSDLRIVISSIYEPRIVAECSRKKVVETLKVVHFPLWDESDLIRLFDLIALNIPKLALDIQARNELLGSCKGSPRFMKTCLKRYLINPLGAVGFSAVISQTRSDLEI